MYHLVLHLLTPNAEEYLWDLGYFSEEDKALILPQLVREVKFYNVWVNKILTKGLANTGAYNCRETMEKLYDDLELFPYSFSISIDKELKNPIYRLLCDFQKTIEFEYPGDYQLGFGISVMPELYKVIQARQEERRKSMHIPGDYFTQTTEETTLTPFCICNPFGCISVSDDTECQAYKHCTFQEKNGLFTRVNYKCIPLSKFKPYVSCVSPPISLSHEVINNLFPSKTGFIRKGLMGSRIKSDVKSDLQS